MLPALTLLLVFQLVGEVCVQMFGLPVPGPVIGMILLFVALVLRGSAPANLKDTAATLLQHLSLLFVPAGAGVMVHATRIGDEWLAIVLSLVGSTLVTIGVTGLVLKWLLRKDSKAAPGDPA